jgi:hypothetical protein
MSEEGGEKAEDQGQEENGEESERKEESGNKD